MTRVLHLPTNVGGGPAGLSHQLRLLGLHSEVWSIDDSYLGYPADRLLTRAQDPIILQLLKVLWAGGYVFGRWDVVHYNYGSTLFSNGGKLLALRQSGAGGNVFSRAATAVLSAAANLLERLELGILRARHIPIFVHYQGDDARQGDYSLAHYDINLASQVPVGYYTPQSDEWKRRQIALLGRRAAGLYAANPDLLNVLPAHAQFVPYGHVAVNDWEPLYTQADHDRLVFAHAPSNRSVKGTDLVLAALDELARDGYQFELDLIEGVDNATALERYRRADVVIDQLFAGWYGGVALEAMALGKPVVVYLRESDFHFLDPEMVKEFPFFQATPETIKDELEKILRLPRNRLVARARLSRAYAEKWHDPARLATQISADYSRAREWQRAGKRGTGVVR